VKLFERARHSAQAFSAPSKQIPGFKPNGDRNLIDSVSALAMISIPYHRPHDSTKREQNPHYTRYNGVATVSLTVGASEKGHGLITSLTILYRNLSFSLTIVRTLFALMRTSLC
jgi:hypothetical protein